MSQFMIPIETLIAANFTETNNTLDNLLREMQGINEALKNINEHLQRNLGETTLVEDKRSEGVRVTETKTIPEISQ